MGAISFGVDYALKASTANVDSLAALVAYLDSAACSSDLVLVQEHHVLEAGVAAAANRLRGLGWHSLWTPALEGAAGSKHSGGTAIVARPFLGLAWPLGEEDLVAVVPAGGTAA